MHVINVCPFISPFTYTSGNMRLFLKSCAGGLVILSRNFISGEPRGLPQSWHSSQHMHCCGHKHENIPLWIMNPLADGHCHASPIVTLLAPPDPAAKGLTLGPGGGKGSASQMLLEGTMLLLSCKYCVHCPGHYEMCAMKSETCDQMHLYTQ